MAGSFFQYYLFSAFEGPNGFRSTCQLVKYLTFPKSTFAMPVAFPFRIRGTYNFAFQRYSGQFTILRGRIEYP